MKKILIVENSSVVIIGLMQILKDIGFDKTVVDTVGSFDGMLAMIDGHAYGLVLFGLKTDEGKQLKSLLEVVQTHAKTIFLIFSETMDLNIQKKMYRAGIKGVLDRMSSKKEISFAMQRVLDNEVYFDTAASMKLFLAERDSKKVSSILTEREKQIADLLVQGKKNIQICDTFKIMPSTVSTIKTKIFNKLNIQNILELKEWVRHGTNY